METVLTQFARWMVVFALLLSYWPFGQSTAHAVTQTAAVWRGHSLLHFKKRIYVAHFDWKGAHYRFEVGTREVPVFDPEHSRFVALITQGGEAVATCERKLTGEMPFDTHSMLLRCEGPLFSPAASTAKFAFGATTDDPQLTIWTGPRAIGQQMALVTEASPVHVAKAE